MVHVAFNFIIRISKRNQVGTSIYATSAIDSTIECALSAKSHRPRILVPSVPTQTRLVKFVRYLDVDKSAVIVNLSEPKLEINSILISLVES